MLAQGSFQHDALVLKCVDGFLGFGSGAAAASTESLDAHRGFAGWSRAKVNDCALHSMPEVADFLDRHTDTGRRVGLKRAVEELRQ